MRLAGRVIRQGGGAAGNDDVRANARRRAGITAGNFGADLLLFGRHDGAHAHDVFLIAAIAVDEQRQPPVPRVHVHDAEVLATLASDEQAVLRILDQGQAGVFRFQLRRYCRAHALRVEHAAIAQLGRSVGCDLETAFRIEAVSAVRCIAHGTQENIVAGQLGHVTHRIAAAADGRDHVTQFDIARQQTRARIDGNAEIRCRVGGQITGGSSAERTAAVAQAELRRQDTDGIGFLDAVKRDAPGVTDIGGHVIHAFVRTGTGNDSQASLFRHGGRCYRHAVGGDDGRCHHDRWCDRCFRRTAIAAATACGQGSAQDKERKCIFHVV